MSAEQRRNTGQLAPVETYRARLALEKRERDQRTALYFIQASTIGLIKIGIALRPKDRLAALQIGSPDKLVLLGVIRQPGAAALERTLHTEMAEHHSHGEWFRPAPELLAYIAENALYAPPPPEAS